MTGKIVCVTGATDGIGKMTALELARQGAIVAIVGRHPEKGKRVIEEIHSATGNETLRFHRADLSLMADVRTLADELASTFDHLDVLVNNAGAFFHRFQHTPEGFERTFALNHLNYFLLTERLLELIKASGKGRIVNVSSEAHRGAKLDLENLNGEKHYSGWKAYQQSKLANILFTYRLHRRLSSEAVTVNCLHPGFVASKFGHNNRGFVGLALRWSQKVGAISVKEGAETSIYLASSPEVEGVSGKYFDKCKPRESSPETYDQSLQDKLWEVSESMVARV
ncbi:MAG: SDR family oxidoreductase [Fidelibacterota bacterium]